MRINNVVKLRPNFGNILKLVTDLRNSKKNFQLPLLLKK